MKLNLYIYLNKLIILSFLAFLYVFGAVLACPLSAQTTYYLSVDPHAITMVRGQTGVTSTVTVNTEEIVPDTVTLLAPALVVNNVSTPLPSWLTAVYSEESTTTSSVLTLEASADAPVGVYQLALKGQATVSRVLQSSTAFIDLTIVAAPPSFSLSVSPESANIPPGSEATYTVSTVPENGFTGVVQLSIAGLPEGITSNLPITGQGTSVSGIYKLTASNTVPPGTYPFTVTGTSGSLPPAKVTFLLTIDGPDFTLSGTLGGVVIAPGQSNVRTAISLMSKGATSGPAVLSVTGLPSGITAAFTAAATVGVDSEITFSATDEVPLDTYTINITATAGSSSASIPMQIYVEPPGRFRRGLDEPSYRGKAVMIYAATIAGTQEERMCVSGSGGSVVVSLKMQTCDYSQPSQKWIPESEGVIRSQVDPRNCVFLVPGRPLQQDNRCAPGPFTVWMVRQDGRIATRGPNVGSYCWTVSGGGNTNGTDVLASACNLNSGPADNTVFKIMPEPDRYIALKRGPRNEALTVTNESQGSLAVQPLQQQTPLTQLWFLERVNAGQAIIHSATNGYCVEQTSYLVLRTFPCHISSGRKNQTWNLAETPYGHQATNVETGYCMTGSINSLLSIRCIGAYVDSWVDVIPKPQQRNAILATMGTSQPYCLGPAFGSSQSLSAINCVQRVEILQSRVDLLPDKSFRFKTSGNCLAAVQPSVPYAQQRPCENGIPFQWYLRLPAKSSTFPVVLPDKSSPLYRWLNITNRAGTSFIGQGLDNGQVVLEGENYQAANWKLEPSEQLDECEGHIQSSAGAPTPPPIPPTNPPDVSLSVAEVRAYRAAIQAMIAALRLVTDRLRTNGLLATLMDPHEITDWRIRLGAVSELLSRSEATIAAYSTYSAVNMQASENADAEFTLFFGEIYRDLGVQYPLRPRNSFPDFIDLTRTITDFQAAHNRLPRSSLPLGLCLGYSRSQAQ